jgi:hypothetical protein
MLNQPYGEAQFFVVFTAQDGPRWEGPMPWASATSAAADTDGVITATVDLS